VYPVTFRPLGQRTRVMALLPSRECPSLKMAKRRSNDPTEPKWIPFGIGDKARPPEGTPVLLKQVGIPASHGRQRINCPPRSTTASW
jgi:hypothetical protein